MPFWINILVGLLAFVVAALGGKALLPWLHKLKFGQPIKVDFGPSWHANKQGTPTMGGLLFIFGSIIATAVGYALYRFFGTTDFVSTFSNREALRLLSCMIFCLLFGVIGFIDDFAKVAKKQNEGLKPMQKIVLQVVAAVLWLAAMYWLGDRDTHIDLGFVRFNISWFYYPLMVLVILYLTNAVNLTDGVDGLCGTVTLVAMLIFTLICSKLQMGCLHPCLPWHWQAAVWAFWCGTCTRRSALGGTPARCFWVLCGRYRTGKPPAPEHDSGGSGVHSGSTVRYDPGDLFQVYQEEVRRRPPHLQDDTDPPPL